MGILTHIAAAGLAIFGGPPGMAAAAGLEAANAANQGQKKAAGAVTQATTKANDTQRYIYDTGRADAAPWRDMGVQALGQMGAYYGFGPNGTSVPQADPANLLARDPGYQFRMSEGAKAVNSGWAARGMRESGAATKALLRYGQDQASQEFGSAWNRLAGVAGVGQQVNQQNNQLGENYANQTGANLLNAGQARASSYASQGETTANVFGQIGGMGTNALNKQSVPSYAPKPYDPFATARAY